MKALSEFGEEDIGLEGGVGEEGDGVCSGGVEG